MRITGEVGNKTGRPRMEREWEAEAGVALYRKGIAKSAMQ